jgi:hypothetical protein
MNLVMNGMICNLNGIFGVPEREYKTVQSGPF